MPSLYALTDTYWTEVPEPSGSVPIIYGTVPTFETLAAALTATPLDRAKAELHQPHRQALRAGEISRLEMQLRRPPIFFVAAIWEDMKYGYSGGEFPGPLVDAYIAHNGDIWPMLEEAGFTKGGDNNRAWSTYEERNADVR